MVKKTITYKDFSGEDVTETAYFHLSQVEIAELEVESDGGLSAQLKQLSDNPDGKTIMRIIKQFLLTSYGVMSEDGKKHRKSQQLRDDFVDSGAYNALWMSLVMDANKAAEFINGIFPAGWIEEVEKLAAQQKLDIPGLTPDIEKVIPRFITRAELEALPFEEYKEAIEKISTGELVVNTDIPD